MHYIKGIRYFSTLNKQRYLCDRIKSSEILEPILKQQESDLKGKVVIIKCLLYLKDS